jgi:A/G-specific adenine glycosylase
LDKRECCLGSGGEFFVDKEDEQHLKDAARRLHDWYRKHHRPLPWRETADPYAIWVSEVMLQQTQVETVKPYYAAFMHRFPDVGTLAAAAGEDVLKAWEGLGYYARARHLHDAARQIVEKHGGWFPKDFDAVAALPGIGRSTAGAILSAAFGQSLPVLDANVVRVLARVLALRGPARSSANMKRLWHTAQEWIDASGDPATHNQAMMELGALVCAPLRPACNRCPLAPECAAVATGSPERFPERKKLPRIPHYHVAVGVTVRGGRILVQRRAERGLLGGLWEFPGGKVESGETPEAALEREFAEELSLAVRVVRSLARVKHAYSHFRVTLHPFVCTVRAARPKPRMGQEWRWVTAEELALLPCPKANKKIFALLEGEIPAQVGWRVCR